MLSIFALMVVVMGLLWLTGAVTFSPGGAKVDSSALPSVNASARLQGMATTVEFAVRNPTVPSDWHANSASKVAADGRQIVEVGWVTPTQGYVRLAQSNGTAMQLAVAEAGLADGSELGPTSSFQIAGQTWDVYPGRRSESSWVTSFGAVHVLITGDGTDAQFRALATAVPGSEVAKG